MPTVSRRTKRWAILRPMTNDVEKATPEIVSAAREILPDVVALRRRLHRRPEIGLDLPETQAVVADELERLGLVPRLGRGFSSVTTTIAGGPPRPPGPSS